MIDDQILEKAIALRAASEAAAERFKQTLVISVSLPPNQPATVTALRGAATLGLWTVQEDEVLETVAAIIDKEMVGCTG